MSHENGTTRHSVFSRMTTRSTPGFPSGFTETWRKNISTDRPSSIEQETEHTDFTGRILAYRSIFLRSATIGEEYPVTFRDGELVLLMY